MLQQLKKKIMPSKLIPALVLLVGVLALTVYLLPSIRLLLQGPQPLYDLSVSELEGAYVEADVDMLIDWYAETVQSKSGSPDKTTHREYLMPVLDGIIGLEVPAVKMSDAEAVMEATNEWMGNEFYEWDGSLVSVVGTVQRMDEETEGYYYEILEAYGMTDEDRDYCPPLVLRYGSVGRLDPGMHNVLLIVDGVLLLLALVFLIQALTGSSLKQVRAYCAALPDPEGAMAQLDGFYEDTPEQNGLRMDRHWLLYHRGGDLWLLAADDVAWVYLTTTTHRTNGIPTGKTHAVTVCSVSERKNKRRHSIVVKSEADGHALIEEMIRCIPNAVYGYNAAWLKPYETDPAAFRRDQLAQRRAAAAAAAAAAAQNAPAASPEEEPAKPVYAQQGDPNGNNQ